MAVATAGRIRMRNKRVGGTGGGWEGGELWITRRSIPGSQNSCRAGRLSGKPRQLRRDAVLNKCVLMMALKQQRHTDQVARNSRWLRRSPLLGLMLLVIYCCIEGSPKTWCLETPFMVTQCQWVRNLGNTKGLLCFSVFHRLQSEC